MMNDHTYSSSHPLYQPPNSQITHTQPECADTDCSHKEMHDEKHSIQFMSPCLTQRKKGSSQKRGAQRFKQESYMNNCKFTNNKWTKLDQTLINFNVNTSLLQIKLNLERARIPRGGIVSWVNLGAGCPSVLPKQGFGSRGTHPGISPVCKNLFEIVETDHNCMAKLIGLFRRLHYCNAYLRHFLKNSTLEDTATVVAKLTLIVKYFDSSGKCKLQVPNPQIKRIWGGCPYLTTFWGDQPAV